MGQPSSVTIGATVPDQLGSALENERDALKLLRQGIATALDVNDQATREFLAGRLPDEEGHVDWLETQLSLIDSIGEANYLAEQLH
jgi:bacterioferritin